MRWAKEALFRFSRHPNEADDDFPSSSSEEDDGEEPPLRQEQPHSSFTIPCACQGLGQSCGRTNFFSDTPASTAILSKEPPRTVRCPAKSDLSTENDLLQDVPVSLLKLETQNCSQIFILKKRCNEFIIYLVILSAISPKKTLQKQSFLCKKNKYKTDRQTDGLTRIWQ